MTDEFTPSDLRKPRTIKRAVPLEDWGRPYDEYRIEDWPTPAAPPAPPRETPFWQRLVMVGAAATAGAVVAVIITTWQRPSDNIPRQAINEMRPSPPPSPTPTTTWQKTSSENSRQAGATQPSPDESPTVTAQRVDPVASRPAVGVAPRESPPQSARTGTTSPPPAVKRTERDLATAPLINKEATDKWDQAIRNNAGGKDPGLGSGHGTSGSSGIEEAGMNGAGKPTILYKEKAKYTEEARQNKVQGTVMLTAVFTADGRITGIRVIRGLPDGLTEKAIEAAQKIRFLPATKNGSAVSVRANLEFTFNV